MKTKRILTLFSIAFLTIFLIGCIEEVAPPDDTYKINITLVIDYSNGSKEVISLEVDANVTVFEVLNNNTQLEYTTHPTYGAFITSINGASNMEEKYWMFYVDGALSGVGTSAYLINQNVIIEMKYEKPEW